MFLVESKKKSLVRIRFPFVGRLIGIADQQRSSQNKFGPRLIYLLSFCLCFFAFAFVFRFLCFLLACAGDPAGAAAICAAHAASRTHIREPRPTLPVFFHSLVPGFCSQVGFVTDHHLYISDQSPGLRVRVELHRIAHDVEVRPPDCLCVPASLEYGVFKSSTDVRHGRFWRSGLTLWSCRL